MPKGCGVNERGTQSAIVEVRQKNGERRDGGPSSGRRMRERGRSRFGSAMRCCSIERRAAMKTRKESGPDSPVPAGAGAARRSAHDDIIVDAGATRAATAIASSPPTPTCPATRNQSPTPPLLPQSSQRALRRDGWWCGCGVRGYTRCGYREDGGGLSTERPQGIARKYHRLGANRGTGGGVPARGKVSRRWYLRGSGYGEPPVVGPGHTALRTHAFGSQDTAYARLQPYGEIAASVPQVVSQRGKMSPTVLGDARWDWRIAAFWPSKAQAAWTRAGSGAEVSGGGGRRAPGPRGRDEGAIPIQREWRASSAWADKRRRGARRPPALRFSPSSDPSKCRGRRGELGVVMVTVWDLSAASATMGGPTPWNAWLRRDRNPDGLRMWRRTGRERKYVRCVYRVEKLDGDGARADSWDGWRVGVRNPELGAQAKSPRAQALAAVEVISNAVDVGFRRCCVRREGGQTSFDGEDASLRDQGGPQNCDISQSDESRKHGGDPCGPRARTGSRVAVAAVESVAGQWWNGSAASDLGQNPLSQGRCGSCTYSEK
ncbi:hypothetical protein C8J57DRAFT_1468896 [Mycena rebaudengoi]|nr:hypothetical protein C8J57DRAFT_1468896 [Mycena rebaudengoi]